MKSDEFKKKDDYFKNRPRNNLIIGVLSGLLIGSCGSSFISLLLLIDALGISSYSTRHDSIVEASIYLSIFVVIAVVSFVIRRRIVLDFYKVVESNLDE